MSSGNDSGHWGLAFCPSFLRKRESRAFPGRTQRGSALIFTIALLAVMVMLSSVITVQVQNRTTRSLYHERLDEALGVAEAGMQDALQKINADPTWNAGFANKAFQNGFYTVAFIAGIDTAGIMSTGWIPDGNGPDWKVTRVVRTEIGDSMVCAAASGNIQMKSAVCQGDAYAQQAMDLSSGSIISGNADALNNISLSSSTISGKIRAQNYPPQPLSRTFAAPDANSYKTQAQAGGTHTGKYKINNQTLTIGPLYITGSLEIVNSTVTIAGTIFSENDVKITNSSINVPNPLALYATGNIDITNNSAFSIGLGGFAVLNEGGTINIVNNDLQRTSVYSPQSQFTINNAVLGGRVVAGQLDMQNATIGGVFVVGLPMPQQFRVLEGTYNIR